MRKRDMADAEQRERYSECSFRPKILNRSRNVVSSSLASGVMKVRRFEGLYASASYFHNLKLHVKLSIIKCRQLHALRVGVVNSFYIFLFIDQGMVDLQSVGTVVYSRPVGL